MQYACIRLSVKRTEIKYFTFSCTKIIGNLKLKLIEVNVLSVSFMQIITPRGNRFICSVILFVFRFFFSLFVEERERKIIEYQIRLWVVKIFVFRRYRYTLARMGMGTGIRIMEEKETIKRLYIILSTI